MEDLKRALDLWIEITGYNPDAKIFRLGDWDLYSINNELNDSLDLDPSGIMTTLMLDYYTEQYLNAKSFAVNNILGDFDALTNYLAKCKELYSLLRSESIQTLRKDFETHMLISVKQYGEVSDELEDAIRSPHDLSFLRRDALKAAAQLQVAQFAQGEPDGRPARFLEHVYEFWNINSMLRMISQTNEAFISVNLIRDPDLVNTYFCFAMKNGGTISVITDKPDWAHPLQHKLIRRPERDFAKRAFKHHFPYNLLDLEYDEDQRELYLKQRSDSLDVVPFQSEVQKLKKIKDLHPFETIWITMMFQLIVEKFWKDNFKTKEISYTGAMVTVNTDRNKELILPHRLVVPAYTSTEVTPESTQGQWRVKPTHQNDWLEKRYEKQIPDSVLSLTGVGDGVTKYLTGSNIEEVNTSTDKQLKELREDEWMHHGTGRTPAHRELTGISHTGFGTKDQILRDMEWHARHNKAVAIQALAEKEYEERKDKVMKWFTKNVEANREGLFEAIAHGSMETWDYVHFGFTSAPQFEMKNILQFSEFEYNGPMNCLRLSGGYIDNHYHCYENFTRASIAAVFRPKTSYGLAMLCGCGITTLPDVLQNWTKDEMYSGNHLLDRVDPMEWVVKDPWRKLPLVVVVYLSIRAYNAICKAHGTTPTAKRYKPGSSSWS